MLQPELGISPHRKPQSPFCARETRIHSIQEHAGALRTQAAVEIVGDFPSLARDRGVPEEGNRWSLLALLQSFSFDPSDPLPTLGPGELEEGRGEVDSVLDVQKRLFAVAPTVVLQVTVAVLGRNQKILRREKLTTLRKDSPRESVTLIAVMSKVLSFHGLRCSFPHHSKLHSGRELGKKKSESEGS